MDGLRQRCITTESSGVLENGIEYYFSMSMITTVAGAVNTGDVWYYSPADCSQLEIVTCDIINLCLNER